jgi:methionyl-tRNA formyltransferase
MKIACIGYRSWSLSIYTKIQHRFRDYEFLTQGSNGEFRESEIHSFDPSIILFYGWSDIITSSLISRYTCLMLHPSPLPKYRGGSPIQNQIIRGETESAVTIFVMDDGIDTGPIVRQEYLSLDGSLKDIFGRIESIGYDLTKDILQNGLNAKEQDHSAATNFSRLTPAMSELTLDELENRSSLYLNNKIRMLQDPYPNPYIKTKDGKMLVINEVTIKS